MLRDVQDVTTLGRLVQIAAFMGHPGDLMDKEFSNELARTTTALRAAATGHDMVRALRGEDPASQMEHEACTIAGTSYVGYAVDGWDDRIIRRGNGSVSWDGITPITQGVPPITVIDAYLLTTEADLTAIEGGNGVVKEK